MKTIEMTGKTVDEALKNALNELKLTKEEVDIEIIDEGSKGIFNLIGNKPARIKITKKKSAIDEVEKFLTDVLKAMDVKAKINIKEENDIINVNLSGEKMGLIIGYRGETLDSNLKGRVMLNAGAKPYLAVRVLKGEKPVDTMRLALDAMSPDAPRA